MEVERSALEHLVNSLKSKKIQIVQYRGRDYRIDIGKHVDSPAWYLESSFVTGAEIGIDRDQIPDKFKRAVILHEIVEADLYIHQQIIRRKAHHRAVREDYFYARKHLNEAEFREYGTFRQRLIALSKR